MNELEIRREQLAEKLIALIKDYREWYATMVVENFLGQKSKVPEDTSDSLFAEIEKVVQQLAATC